MKRRLAIVIGTGIQEKICRAIYPELNKSSLIGHIEVISLERYYRLGLGQNFENQRVIRDFLPQPWYDRSVTLKLFSLLPYLWQLYLISLKTRHFVFFVDTGILERSGIFFLQAIGCKVAVVQDALKRRPIYGSPRSLNWFGGSGADLYLLLGERYRTMIPLKSSIEFVGSPIYSNNIESPPLGKNILIINQCFANYGEVSPKVEANFIAEVIKEAIPYGPIELRLHPHNDSKLYRNLTSSRINVTQKRPLRQSLIDAGIVLCINSTVILEALALNRPVITLAWHPSPFDQPVDDAVTKCNNLGQMKRALDQWVSQRALRLEAEKLQELIKGFIAYDGEESKKRIVSALESFVSSI